MDYLKEGIGLRAMAQRDPLIEYQREGFMLFQAMTEAIKEESVGFLYNLEVKVQPGAPVVSASGAAAAAGSETAQALGAGGAKATGAQAEPVLVAKGLDGPDRAIPLSYTAPSEDGVGPVTAAAGAAPGDGEAAPVEPVNREARRRAAKQTKKS
jgi:preprotein translocase subunit SecA